VSIKLQIEAGMIRLSSGKPEQQQAAQAVFEHAADQLSNVMAEVRRISHNLRPAILDDLGLAAALQHLAKEYTLSSGTPVHFEASGLYRRLARRRQHRAVPAGAGGADQYRTPCRRQQH
jgi:two-component system NarL family sensor kinase